jgi:uncharacterized protein
MATLISAGYLWSLSGGLLIGVAVWIMLAGLGRITGVSGIAATAAATAMTQPRQNVWRFAFLGGLVVGGALFAKLFAASTANVASTPWIAAAGLLVGFGTVLGSGCTSGHGVCGLGRRSLRSLAATLTFMAAGMATVAILNVMRGGGA